VPPVLTRIERPHLLLVEGEEETRFWNALLRTRARSDVQVHAVGGKFGLNPGFGAVVRTSGFADVTWLGIAQDADDDPGATFDRVCNVVTREGLPRPTASWVCVGSSPAVVALVLPDGVLEGDLEALVWQSVESEPSAACVLDYFACLQACGRPLPRQIHKARIHAHLAALERPDCRLGEAAEIGLLPLNSPAFDRLVALIP
jgi:hypothetical protein